ncbi:putative zincin peptidase [Luteococcus japonicus]|uniref:Putative zincin peptidase n=1 Tax=Luteococcus japonicus TaxID=33984 RepID=A0A3N1ZUZ0_9ACTN|nr:DUF3267 domain-containing protein [Luteococcus japonicus]ROR54578.1 putative zincin peptidase [Luteococcus japonicus]
MMTPPAESPEDDACSKTPGERSQAWMAALGTGLLFVGAAIGLGVLAWHGAASGIMVFTARKMLKLMAGTTLITIGTLALHELLHGVGMLALGARPRFGAGVMTPGLPYLYTTCEGHTFSRSQYIVVAALPNVVINIGLLALMAWGPHAAWWVLPFAIHLSGGVGDAWLCWAAWAEQPGTRIEDQRFGVRVHRRRQPVT